MAIGSPTEQITKKPPLLMDPVPFSIPELTIRGENGWEMQLLGRTERVGGGGGEVWGVGGWGGGCGLLGAPLPHFTLSLPPFHFCSAHFIPNPRGANPHRGFLQAQWPRVCG